MDRRKFDVLGCPVDALTLNEAVAQVVDLVDRGRPSYAVPVNAAKIVRMGEDAGLRRFVRRADLVLADGASVLLAARLAGTPLPERVTGVDLTTALFAEARARSWRVFLLGARPDVVADAAALMGAVGWCNGYFTDERRVVDAVRAARPDVLLVAMGTPRQEHFLARHLADLPVSFAMGVGGSLDVLTGRVRRVPRGLGNAGLEWAWRLALQPRVRWRRAVLDSGRFVGRLVLGRRLPQDDPQDVPPR